LDALGSAAIGVPGKARGRSGLLPARTSNAAWRAERGAAGCIARWPRRWTWSKPKNAVFISTC